jgi:hypothetical protein
LWIAQKLVVLTKGGLTAPRAVRPGLASTIKNYHNKGKKAHPSSKKPPC